MDDARAAVTAVKTTGRKLERLLSQYVSDFKQCGDNEETGEVVDGDTLTGSLRREAEMFANRAEQWIHSMEEQLSRLHEVDRVFSRRKSN